MPVNEVGALGLGQDTDKITLRKWKSECKWRNAEKQAAILRAEGEKEARIMAAEAEAEAIAKVQQALADSIALHGVVQPLTVRQTAGGYYQIIAGERRWRAARMAELREIPAVIIEADDKRLWNWR